MKILHIDIETSPFEVLTFSLRNKYIPIENMITDPRTICWAAKWDGDKKIIFDSEWHSGHKNMIKHAHELLEEADAIVHWNGTSFDHKWLNMQFLEYNLVKPEVKNIDLMRVARSNFYSPSYKLDYFSKRLKIGQKIKHEGFRLWKDCLSPADTPERRKARRIMEKYNRQDTLLLEDMYARLKPWMHNHPNWNLYIDDERPVCPTCGSDRMRKKGLRSTRVALYQRWICNNCKSQCQGQKINKPVLRK
jgi:DNA polymerase elongation subunit (family B)